MKSVLGRGISVFGESSCFLFAHELSCHMKLLFCMYAGIHRKQFCMALNSYKKSKERDEKWASYKKMKHFIKSSGA